MDVQSAADTLTVHHDPVSLPSGDSHGRDASEVGFGSNRPI